jgi:hypothetical protein
MKKISNKMITLYCLNVTDVIFTQILLAVGAAYEANPFMKPLTKNTLAIVLVKIIVPGLLLWWVFKRMQGINGKVLKTSNIMVTSMLYVYGLINCLHVFTSVIAMIYMS